MQTITLKIEGMTCQGCVASVTRILRGTPGVSTAEVSLQPGQARVSYDSARVVEAGLRQAIEAAGYDVTGAEE